MEETRESFPHLREIVLFLAATGLLVPVLQRLKLSPILGFLVAGIIIGPYGLGLYAGHVPVLHWFVISDVAGVRALADLGVVFLLFTIGLELSLERLWRMRSLVFGLGGLQVMLTAAVIAVIAHAMDVNWIPASVLGAALALSSTAIVLGLLTEQGRLSSPPGRTAFSVLLFQDLAVIPILFLLGALNSGGMTNIGPALGLALLKAAAAVTLIFALGRVVIRPLFRFVGTSRNPELFMAVTLLAVLGTGAAGTAAGLSMPMGAFLAGLLLSETEYRHQVDVDMAPFKGLLLGLFFMSVGMGIDFQILGRAFVPIVIAVVGVFVLKSAITTGLALAFRQPLAVAVEAGLTLGQVGEFAFVIAAAAAAYGIFSSDLDQIVLMVTSLTMFATPLVIALARRIAKAIETPGSQSAPSPDFESLGDLSGHVIVAGYGRVGSLLGQLLDRQKIPHVALDRDPIIVGRHRAAGREVFYGDAARPGMLARAGADKAQALVVTMDSPQGAQEVVSQTRKSWPELPIYARARDVEHARHLVSLGATKAVPENLEATLQLAQDALEAAGIPSETAWHLSEELRANVFEAGGAADPPAPKTP
jgi:monovalent cation:proton antiporter-2 (CPA2) family protein